MASKETLDLIKRYEGLRTDAYQDDAGNWTIGYGHLITDRERPRYASPITAADATRLLQQDILHAENFVDHACRNVPTTEDQRGAMTSLAYNIGVGAFAGSSVLRFHLAGDYEAASKAFSLWDKIKAPNGEYRRVRGLARRRADEAAMYYTGCRQPALTNP